MTIESSDIEIAELIEKYGAEDVLRSLISYQNFDSRLRKDLQIALDNYTEKYDRDDDLYKALYKQKDKKQLIEKTKGCFKDSSLTTEIHRQFKNKKG